VLQRFHFTESGQQFFEEGISEPLGARTVGIRKKPRRKPWLQVILIIFAMTHNSAPVSTFLSSIRHLFQALFR